MKTEKPKRAATRKAKRPAPVGNAANPSSGNAGKAQGAAAYSNRARPSFIPEGTFEELTGEELKDCFEPSPFRYDCACLYLAAEASRAYKNGDNDLLSRDGVADAIACIANPYNANPFNDRNGGGHYPEMLKEWREDCKREAMRKAAYYLLYRDDILTMRDDFTSWFDTSRKPDTYAEEMRALFLERLPEQGETIREFLRAREHRQGSFVEGLFKPQEIDAEPNPADVHAEWVNARFAQAGKPLVKWLRVAVLPDYAERIESIRKEIADNYGVFPAPFCARLFSIEPTTDILNDLLYIARDMAGRKGANANRPAPVAADCDAARDAGEPVAGHIGKWAAAQGVSDYSESGFKFKGWIIERDEKQAKRWGVFRAVIESDEIDGAAKLGVWRGIFSTAKDGYHFFSRHIHPVTGRGTGWYRIESQQIKGRRSW